MTQNILLDEEGDDFLLEDESGDILLDSSILTKEIDSTIKGRHGSPEISCPALDPEASIQIEDNLIKIYQSRIDALINQLGKNVLLEFDPIIEPCPNCFQDIMEHRSNGIYKPGGPIPFPRGQKCDYCKGLGFLEKSVNKCIKMLLEWNPKNDEGYKISVKHRGGIVRLKGFLTDGPDLIKCKTIIVNHDTSNIIKLRVKLIKGPTIVGLREERYIIVYGKMI